MDCEEYERCIDCDICIDNDDIRCEDCEEIFQDLMKDIK